MASPPRKPGSIQANSLKEEGKREYLRNVGDIDKPPGKPEG